jgi:hypothetical protein
VSESRVSTETLREHYGIWRWRIERDSSNRLVQLWVKIGASNLDNDTKVDLVNVAWALASFERAYDVLVADMGRAEHAHNVGVPAVMSFLTGPYEGSLTICSARPYGWISVTYSFPIGLLLNASGI